MARETLRIPPWVALPAIGWFIGFLLIPLGFILVYSFAQKGVYGGIVFQYSLENYVRAGDWLYLRIFWNSLQLAFLTAASCLLLAYPLAYAMATAPAWLRPLLMMAVVLPFWTNFVIRVYAIKVLLSEHGPVSWILAAVGLTAGPVSFLNGPMAVWVGMVTNYLPFMVLPLYVVLEKFDFTLLEAARDLGASTFQMVTRILLPLTRRGMTTGFILVFTPALGEFVIPDLLGGARVMMIGNLISEQFLKTRDWPFGSALALILIATVMVSLVVYMRNSDEGKVRG
jgi:spermidine/putrescine transport system permease protein